MSAYHDAGADSDGDGDGEGDGNGDGDGEDYDGFSNKRKRNASGLGNLGNTCFMNSTLQCLAHTEPLRRYFIDGGYTSDLNRDNPLGTGGELATEFARLLRQMWGLRGGPSSARGILAGAAGRGSRPNSGSSYGNGYYSSPAAASSSSTGVVYPRDFKYTLGRHAEQFMGYDQHDSQELATYLLDALHEDTNRVTKKPYVEKPEQGEDEPDDVAAEKAWDLHLRREDSRVLESFMGQVKSRVQCPIAGCGRVSTTFDPFMYLSVPIPGATDRTMMVTYVPLDPNEAMKTLSLTLSKMSSVATMQGKIVDLINTQCDNEGDWEDGAGPDRSDLNRPTLPLPPLRAEDVCLADVWSHEVYSFYAANDEVDKIRDNDFTYVYELRSVASIRQEEEEDGSGEEDEGDGQVGEEGRTDARLDASTVERLLDEDDDNFWQAELGRYLSQPTGLVSLTNPARTTHEDRMAFHFKLDRFLRLCQKCPDSLHVSPRPRRKLSQRGEGEVDKNSITVSSWARCAGGKPVTDEDFNGVSDDNSGTSSPNPAATDDGDNEDKLLPNPIDPDAPTLSERCESSSTFRNVDKARDLAVLELCTRRFLRFSRDLAQAKKDKYRDGVAIQVLFKRQQPPPSSADRGGTTTASASSSSSAAVSYSHSGVGIERAFAAPLVMRVSPRTTVFEFRREIGRRLTRALRGGQPVVDERKGTLSDGRSTRCGPLFPLSVLDTRAEVHDRTAAPEAGETVVDNDRYTMDMMRQIPLTYDRKAGPGFRSNNSYRKLGSLLRGPASSGEPVRSVGSLASSVLHHPSTSFASPSDDGESDLVADLVGLHGTVQLHFPPALSGHFDSGEWDRVEDMSPSPDEEDQEKDSDGGDEDNDGDEEEETDKGQGHGRRRQRKGHKKKKRKKKKHVDILDCISKYCQMEQLEETEMWYCSKCKEHVQAWKQFHLYRAPPILIVHLKRFHFSAATHRRDKIDSFVDFPLRGLDLRGEVMQWDRGSEPVYDCYAVSNHYGGLGGGHYTAYALNDDGVWCHFDDSRVTTGVGEREIKSAAAYVLYYKRREADNGAGARASYGGYSLSTLTGGSRKDEANNHGDDNSVRGLDMDGDSPLHEDTVRNLIEEEEDDDEEMDVDSAAGAVASSRGSSQTCPSPMDMFDADDSNGGRQDDMSGSGGGNRLELEFLDQEENPQGQ